MKRAVLAAIMATNLVHGGGFTDEENEEIQGIVHKYLVEHPEVLIEASQALRNKQQKVMEEQAMTAISQHADQIFNSTSPIVGNIDGSVSMVEFFDYQCPHCVTAHHTVKKLLGNNDNLRVIYKQFPILGEVSLTAAKSVLAAQKQNKSEDLHNALMNRGAKDRISEDKIYQLAEDIGLDVTQLKSDMESSAVEEEIRKNHSLAASLKINATPAFIISENPYKEGDHSYFVPGALPIEKMQQLIDKTAN